MNPLSAPDVEHQDPMSSDRRVLIIGLVVMLLFVTIGVMSASVFTASACEDLQPGSPEEMLVTAGPATTNAIPAGLEAEMAALEATLGEPSGVASVPGATQVTWLEGEVAALGETTAVLGATGDELRSNAAFEEVATLVGSGERIFALALMNTLTGQVDALVPLDADLEPGTCQDTAVVGDPLAFYLDAAGGELVQFRVEEDGSEPSIELRDAFTGRRWMTEIQMPVAPAGVLGERVSGGWHDDTIVVARRVIPGEVQPAIVALRREDGEVVWEMPADEVVAAVGDEEPLWLEVVHLDADVAVIAAAQEERRDRAQLLVVDQVNGSLRAVVTPAGEPVTVHAVGTIDGALFVAWQDGDQVVASFHEEDLQDNDRLHHDEMVELGRWAGTDAVLAGQLGVLGSVIVPDLGELVADGTSDPDTLIEVGEQLDVLDVAVQGEALTVLLRTPEDPSVVVTFAPEAGG